MELCGDALDVPPDEREPLVQRATVDDTTVRNEVFRLLAEADRMDSDWLKTLSEIETIRNLPAGNPESKAETGEGAPPARLGHYEVLQRLGAGGMGEVY